MPNVVPGYSTKMYWLVNTAAVICTMLYVLFLVYQGINEVSNPPTKITSHSFKSVPMPGFFACPYENNVSYVAYEGWGCSIWSEETWDYTECSLWEDDGCWYFNHGFDVDGEYNQGFDLASIGKGEQLEIFFEVTAGNMSEVYYLASEIGIFNQTYYGDMFPDYVWANWNELTVGSLSASYFTPLFFDPEIDYYSLETDEWGVPTDDSIELLTYTYSLATTTVTQNVPKDATNDDWATVDLRIKAQGFTVTETAEFSSFSFFSVVSAVGGFWSLIGGVISFLFVATYKPPTRFVLDKKAAVEAPEELPAAERAAGSKKQESGSAKKYAVGDEEKAPPAQAVRGW